MIGAHGGALTVPAVPAGLSAALESRGVAALLSLSCWIAHAQPDASCAAVGVSVPALLSAGMSTTALLANDMRMISTASTPLRPLVPIRCGVGCGTWGRAVTLTSPT